MIGPLQIPVLINRSKRATTCHFIIIPDHETLLHPVISQGVTFGVLDGRQVGSLTANLAGLLVSLYAPDPPLRIVNPVLLWNLQSRFRQWRVPPYKHRLPPGQFRASRQKVTPGSATIGPQSRIQVVTCEKETNQVYKEISLDPAHIVSHTPLPSLGAQRTLITDPLDPGRHIPIREVVGFRSVGK